MTRKKVTKQSVRQARKYSEEVERQKRRTRVINVLVGVALLAIIVVGAITIFRIVGTPAEESSAEQESALVDTPAEESSAEEEDTLIDTPADKSPAEETISQSEEGDTLSEQQVEKTLGDDRPLADVEPAERFNFYGAYPDMIIDTDNEYEAILSTSKGDIRVRLFDDESPLTVNSFVFLASQGFYDGLTFHRVIADFMAQGGDPTGQGFGGPGYQFEDETDNGLTFDRPGLLAMANSGPNTNGSQFFITYVPTPHLNGGHTIFGEIIEGADVLSALEKVQPGGASGSQADVIERIDIVERS